MTSVNTEQYSKGTQAVNSFFALLGEVMEEVMPPPARFVENGAYVWRGFQIANYQDLAPGQYYCLLYPEKKWHTKTLVFGESYQDPACQSKDKYSKSEGIKSSTYCYPFRMYLDLYRSRFFYLGLGEQHDLLKNFIAYAVQQALIWQGSSFRAQTTSPEFLHGSDHVPGGRKANNIEIQPVGIEFMEVWKTQHQLFEKLKGVLIPYRPPHIKTLRGWWRFNAHTSHFDFRGYFMKSGKLIPGKFDVRWLIFYDSPHLLQCCTSKNEPIDTYDLVQHNYFDLTPDQQVDALDKFVKEIFQ